MEKVIKGCARLDLEMGLGWSLDWKNVKREGRRSRRAESRAQTDERRVKLKRLARCVRNDERPGKLEFRERSVEKLLKLLSVG